MKSAFLIACLAFASSISAQVRKLVVEPNHSTIGFSISIAGFSVVTGKFMDFEIALDWNDQDVSASKISSEIKVSSINTGIPDRDTHLRSSDFFDASQYPTITFTSDSIQRVDYSHFNAFGKLTMHGITKEIILPFQITKMEGNTIGIKSRTAINRLDYDVGSGFKHTSMPNFLSKEVEVEIDFWTRKRKE